MRAFLQLTAGAALALAFVVFALRSRKPARMFAGGLLIAALIYVVFAIVGGNVRDVLVELAGVVAFGWLVHVGWDVFMHHGTYVPSWYPMTCIGFDVLVAIAIVRRSMQRSS